MGVDGLEGGRDAIALAARLAPLTGGRIVLVHAYPVQPPPWRGSVLDYDRAMGAEAEKLLAAERDQAGIEAEIAPFRSASPAYALHQMASAGEDDLIVVGSSRRGAFGRLLAGDHVRGTLNAAPCAVAVAPVGLATVPAQVAAIGVGFEDSPEGLGALVRAAGLARAGGASLEVLSVISEPAAPAFGWPVAYDFDTVADESRRVAAETLQRATADLGVPVRVEVRVGRPGHELVGLSERVDLLVVGSRGFGPARRVIIGSTSDYAAHRARCPVLVLPRVAAEAPEKPPSTAVAAGAGV